MGILSSHAIKLFYMGKVYSHKIYFVDFWLDFQEETISDKLTRVAVLWFCEERNCTFVKQN